MRYRSLCSCCSLHKDGELGNGTFVVYVGMTKLQRNISLSFGFFTLLFVFKHRVHMATVRRCVVFNTGPSTVDQ